jgi:hypothetical protein
MPQLRVSVTPLYLSATADVRELRALVSAAVWQIKTADIVLAEWIEFLTLADAFSISESISNELGKVLADSALLADAIDSFLIGLGKTDQAAFTDAEIRDVSKVLADSAALSEALTQAFSKVLADTATVTDDRAIDLGKPLSDTANVTDDRVNHFTKVAFSPYAEDYFFEDYTEATDYIYFSEGKTFAISKVLADTVNATDDVNGVLADDDQTLGIFKSLDHVLSLAESKAFALSRPASDSFVVADSAALALGKNFSDSGSFTDAQTVAIELGKTETASVAEAAVLAISITAADGANLSDSVGISYGANPADSASFTDARVFDLSLSKAETPTIADAFTYSGAKPFADSASVAESAALQFSHPASDALSISEASVLAFGLGSSDTATFTDAGSLLNQDYTEAFYFAEDYVGTSRTF